MRVEICYNRAGLDRRGAAVDAESLDVVLLDGVAGFSGERLGALFADPVVQVAAVDGSGPDVSAMPDWTWLVEVSYRAGVTDPTALTAREALQAERGDAGTDAALVVQTAVLWLFRSAPDPSEMARVTRDLHNPLIQQAVVLTRSEWDAGTRLPLLYPTVTGSGTRPVETVPLTRLDGGELEALSKRRLLALTLTEMQVIRDWYLLPDNRARRAGLGLPDEPTDVELEMIAQTWSEHCKHKIFGATIHYTDKAAGTSEEIRSLYATYIKQTTRDLEPRRPWLRSVFHDNSGVFAFDEQTLVCFKVETHNSPSALDPFGGAITGLVGVNRDILGTGKGAKPIFNTNYLCFGDPSTPADQIPPGLLPPRTVLRGVHRGIVEGGNHSGIPTVAGGFLFDESYLGKPLVFCGTGGLLPARVNGEAAEVKHIDAGDLVVMLGGRIGKDGIHGATFSSLALDETSPTSAVQIGDPITQKKMLDLLIEARDLGLFKGLTDNGAGGLSSSLGEMADSSGGVRIDLDLCPLKYHGLAPWEILVSESQERMSLAVDPARVGDLLDLAARRGVEGTVIGAFTDDGWVDLRWEGRPVGALSLDFLHRGLPPMSLRAVWAPPVTGAVALADGLDLRGTLLSLLADPTVASKEGLVRQYDHEVQARSVVKPFCGEERDGPTEGAVLKVRPDSDRGLTVTHGISPRVGDTDPYQMAWNAVDEAYRSHVALGGDPEFAAVLDNFCWPDPVESPATPDGATKLAQLVRCCQGLRDACLSYGLPLISGKDSMKNDAVMNGRKVSIRPTLLISLMGVIPDVHRAMTTDFLQAGDTLVVLGRSRAELAGSTLEKVLGLSLTGVPTVRPDESRPLYAAVAQGLAQGWFRSLHDLADGGLGVALAESALGGRLGAELDLALVPGDDGRDAVTLFAETPSRFLASVRPETLPRLRGLLPAGSWAVVGSVVAEPELRVLRGGGERARWGLDELLTAWNALGGLA